MADRSVSSPYHRLDQIRKQAGFGIEGIPPGAITVQEYKKRYQCSETTARRQLATLESLGLLKKAAAWIRRGNNKYKILVYELP